MTAWITTFENSLVACIQAEFTDDPLDTVTVMPGAAITVNECAGIGYVRLSDTFPFTEFPYPSDQADLSLPLAYPLAVGALRCFDAVEEDGTVDLTAYSAAAARQNEDMLRLHRAILCCDRTVSVSIGSFTPSGPEGGLVGGEWLITVAP